MLIAVAALLLTGAILIEKNSNLTALQLLPVYLVPYLLIGYNTLREAGEGIAKGNWFNVHFLMSLATV
ncbi:MAG: heavy metal translocating P-type ATPase, partial [Bacteroidaceae bacterium]|nr:heavy metal translocating P-type ATPase [Bacteroidaceae bacterium]